MQDRAWELAREVPLPHPVGRAASRAQSPVPCPRAGRVRGRRLATGVRCVAWRAGGCACAAPEPVPRGGLRCRAARRRSRLSSRSHVHVHSQIWRPPAPGLTGCRCRRPRPRDSCRGRPVWSGGVTATPSAVAVEPCSCCVTASDVPSLSTRIETFVFWTPALCRRRARSVGAGRLRSCSCRGCSDPPCRRFRARTPGSRRSCCWPRPVRQRRPRSPRSSRVPSRGA